MGYFTYCRVVDNQAARPDAVISATNQNTNYPDDNLTELPISKFWRTNDRVVTAQTIQINLGAAREIDLVALVNHNFSFTSSVVLRAGSSASPDGSQFTRTIPTRELDMFLILPTVQNFQYWSVQINDTNNRDGFLSAGYLILGRRITFDFGFNFNWKYIDNFYNLRHETEFGAIHSFWLYERVMLELQFEHLLDTQARAYREFFRSVGRGDQPFFLIPDADKQDGHFGRLESKLERTVGHAFRQRLPVRFTEDSRGKTASGTVSS